MEEVQSVQYLPGRKFIRKFRLPHHRDLLSLPLPHTVGPRLALLLVAQKPGFRFFLPPDGTVWFITKRRNIWQNKLRRKGALHSEAIRRHCGKKGQFRLFAHLHRSMEGHPYPAKAVSPFQILHSFPTGTKKALPRRGTGLSRMGYEVKIFMVSMGR